MTLIKRKMYLSKYRKAKNRVNRKKLGVFPLVDAQDKFAIYLMHKNIRTIQHVCDKIIKCPRDFIHKKYNFYYIKLIGNHTDRWVNYMKTNKRWKREL